MSALAAASAPHAPPKGRYRLSSLLNVPNRLLHPGELIEKEQAARTPDKFPGVTAGVGEPAC